MNTSEMESRIKELENEVRKLRDLEEIRRLQKSYGYYLEHWMADEIIDLFSDSPGVTLSLFAGIYIGKESVRRYFVNESPEPNPEFLHTGYWYDATRDSDLHQSADRQWLYRAMGRELCLCVADLLERQGCPVLQPVQTDSQLLGCGRWLSHGSHSHRYLSRFCLRSNPDHDRYCLLVRRYRNHNIQHVRQGTNEQWAPSPSSVSATSSNTQVFSMYNQYLQTLSYSIVDGGSPSAPTATGTELGSAYAPTLTTTATGYWFDATGTVAFTNPLSGSSSSERWQTQTTSVSATSSNTQVVTYYNQYSQTLSYNVNDGGSGYSAPATISGLEFGSSYTPTLTTTATGYWFDAIGSLTFTNPLTGSGSTEQWAENSVSLSLTSSNTNVVQYYNQYKQTLSYSVSGGGSPTAPTLTSTQFGDSYTPTLTGTAMAYWLDSGQSWSVTNPLGGSGSTERWDSSQTVSGTVSLSSPTTVGGSLVFAYYNQYLQTLSYSVIDGGTPTAPTATGTEFGSAYASSLTTTATGYWFDATGSVTFSTSTGTNEQWAPSPSSVSATSSNTQVFSMYNQYKQTLSYTIVDGGSPTAPTATGTSLGSVYAPSLTTTATVYWFDATGVITISTPTNGASESWSPSPASISATVVQHPGREHVQPVPADPLLFHH